MSRIFVQFKGLDEGGEPKLKGNIQWDGKTFHCTPRSYIGLLSHPILMGKKRINSQDDPVGFLKALHHQYASAYFYAMPAVEIGDDGLPKQLEAENAQA